MAAYYLRHENTNNPPHIIPDHGNNLHTLIFMNNPNFAPQFDQQPFPPHHFIRPDKDNATLYGHPQEQASEASRAREGLSLSLNPGSGGAGGGQVSVLRSKYLRPTQEFLEEVANVRHLLIIATPAAATASADESHEKGKEVGNMQSDEGVQLSSSQRQEIQMKKAKLVTMLDEAEERYKHYNNQVQNVIESFERAAGIGSAKTYTALALKTISKQFRCLKDAIQGQIRAANKSLGEGEGGSGSTAGKIQGSRLKFIDHQIRQQRALQQLGMIQNHNAWRSRRGLPERSVSVLRAWLFEHFLHPYPKDSDKILLAKRTGLTRSQVSNWFINARVRLWKPMIEEMYSEELKDREQNDTDDKSNSNDSISRASLPVIEPEKNRVAETQVKPIRSNQHNNGAANLSSSFMSITQHGFTINGSLGMEGISQGSPKRQRSNEMLSNGEILIKFGDEKQEGNNEYPINSGRGMNFIGGESGLYNNTNVGELGRFETEEFHTPRYLQGNNGGISLSLGLPPSCDNHHQQFNNLSGASHGNAFINPNQNIVFRYGNDFGFVQ